MTRLAALTLLISGLLVGGWSVGALGEILDDRAGSLAPLSATPAADAAGDGPLAEPGRAAAPAPTSEPRHPRPTPELPAITTRSARIADLERVERAAPARLRIPSLEIDAPIGEIGVLADGALEIPEDVTRLGWYRFGSAPGEPAGSTVVTGHVDSRTQGAGAFFELGRAEPGARVEVELSDGRTLDYEVVGRQRIDKDALPTDDVFRRSGPPVLTLITCGGTFDRTARSYADNVLVVAEPVS